jgi:hypothetical protein
MPGKSASTDALGPEVQDKQGGALSGRPSSDLDAWTRDVDDGGDDDDFMDTPDLVPLVSPEPKHQTLTLQILSLS